MRYLNCDEIEARRKALWPRLLAEPSPDKRRQLARRWDNLCAIVDYCEAENDIGASNASMYDNGEGV